MSRLWRAALRSGFVVLTVKLKYTFALYRLDQQSLNAQTKASTRPGRYSRGGGTRRRNGAAPDAADDPPHRQSPSCGKRAAYDKSLRVERHDATPALDLRKSPKPAAGLFHLPTGPGLGLQINEAELAKRRSRNYPAPENRGDECDGCFKVRLGNQ